MKIKGGSSGGARAPKSSSKGQVVATHCNGLGRQYVHGLPLRMKDREKILQMYKEGKSPSTIEEETKVWRCTVNSLIRRYKQTGSIKPSAPGRPPTASKIKAAIKRYKIANPTMSWRVIRKRLVVDKICDQTSAPSKWTIYKVINEMNGNGSSTDDESDTGDPQQQQQQNSADTPDDTEAQTDEDEDDIPSTSYNNGSDDTEARHERMESEAIAESAELKRKLVQTENEKIELERDLQELRLESDRLTNDRTLESNRRDAQMVAIKEDYERALEEVKSTKRAEDETAKRKADRIETSSKQLRASVMVLKKEQLALAGKADDFSTQIKVQLADVERKICAKISAALNISNTKRKNEFLLRKKLHNELVEVKGNIRVFARVRPIVPSDVEQPNAIELDKDDDTSLSVNYKGRSRPFTLDKVFGPQHDQADIFSEVQPLITSVLDGYNVCILAYGQTGSGKTHTMEGPSDDPGINRRALARLFEEIETGTSRSDCSFKIAVSMLEIYNEKIYDLLSNDRNELEVKINSDVKLKPEACQSDGKLHDVPGSKWMTCKNVQDVDNALKTGRKNRATASTSMNEHSSRSHAILRVEVVGVDEKAGITSHGRLNLVDLAGSECVGESQAIGDRLEEASNINKSLSALVNVISALRNKQKHVPFRNSELTYLLQDSLGGKSKTLMVVQVTPLASHARQTAFSLDFGERVGGVELGRAKASRTTLQSTNGKTNKK